MDTSRPVPRNGARRFRYTALTSSTAYHALPAAMATAHDAIFRALVVRLRSKVFARSRSGRRDTFGPIAETRGGRRAETARRRTAIGLDQPPVTGNAFGKARETTLVPVTRLSVRRRRSERDVGVQRRRRSRQRNGERRQAPADRLRAPRRVLVRDVPVGRVRADTHRGGAVGRLARGRRRRQRARRKRRNVFARKRKRTRRRARVGARAVFRHAAGVPRRRGGEVRVRRGGGGVHARALRVLRSRAAHRGRHAGRARGRGRGRGKGGRGARAAWRSSGCRTTASGAWCSASPAGSAPKRRGRATRVSRRMEPTAFRQHSRRQHTRRFSRWASRSASTRRSCFFSSTPARRTRRASGPAPIRVAAAAPPPSPPPFFQTTA